MAKKKLKNPRVVFKSEKLTVVEIKFSFGICKAEGKTKKIAYKNLGIATDMLWEINLNKNSKNN